MELEAEAFGPAGEDLNPSTMCYQCPTCQSDEERSCMNAMRGRAKTRSLSASPALGSTKEFRRTRSLHGPCPVTTFGPKACMLQNPQAIMLEQLLLWGCAGIVQYNNVC